MSTVVVSGGFDPVHPGHLDLFREAAEHGDLIVVLNSDDWLLRKKGFVFQSWRDRAKILTELRMVSAVEHVNDSDGTVCEALERLRPDFFANGGDRAKDNTPETEFCTTLGIGLIFGAGGGKTASSSVIGSKRTVHRSWGQYDVLGEGDWWKAKRLVVAPGSKSSFQRHGKRGEVWVYPDGSVKNIAMGEWHQLVNLGDRPLEIIEVQIGECLEDDIERRPGRCGHM